MSITINKKQLALQWETKKLSDICDLQNGYAFKSDSYINYSNTLNIRMSNIRPNGEFDPEHNIRFLPDLFASEYAQFLLKDGDLIVAMTDMAGDPKILGLPTLVENLNGRNFLLNQRVGKLHSFSNQVDVSYLRYFLSSPEIKEYYKSKGTGGLQINISKKDILSATIPVPPLSEQKRIVSIVDQAFEGIDRAIANTQKNLTNARELFESALYTAIFADSEKDDWHLKTVSDVVLSKKGSIRTGPFGSQLLHSEFVDEGIAVLGVDNAVENEFRWGKKRFITPEKFRQLSRYQVNPGDVLITIMGTCGRCAIVPDDIPTAINTKHLCCITLNRTQCLPGFLHAYFLHHPIAQQFLTERAKGSIMSGLNMEIIRELPLRLPSISKQQIIIEKIKSLSHETQRLEAIYQQKLAALNELKQVILQKAFTGELTADTANQATKTTEEVIAA